MTRTQKITAVTMTAVLLTAAVGWLVMPRGSHEIVLKPTQGVRR